MYKLQKYYKQYILFYKITINNNVKEINLYMFESLELSLYALNIINQIGTYQ